MVRMQEEDLVWPFQVLRPSSDASASSGESLACPQKKKHLHRFSL